MSQQHTQEPHGAIHNLKTDPEVFDAVASGKKTFEIRFDDRGFKVGDTLHLQKTTNTGASMAGGAPLEYTGDSINVVVSHILRGPCYGLANGWVILSIQAESTTKQRDDLLAERKQLVAKAGEVMRERCAYETIRIDSTSCARACKEIRALPGVTLGDLK